MWSIDRASRETQRSGPTTLSWQCQMVELRSAHEMASLLAAGAVPTDRARNALAGVRFPGRPRFYRLHQGREMFGADFPHISHTNTIACAMRTSPTDRLDRGRIARRFVKCIAPL